MEGEDTLGEDELVVKGEENMVVFRGRRPVTTVSSLAPDLLLDKSEEDDDVVDTDGAAMCLDLLTGCASPWKLETFGAEDILCSGRR